MITTELWLSIIAIIASIASVGFVILQVGIKLGVGFREDETTSARKVKIEKAISDESNSELATVAELINSKRTDSKELKERILKLARIDIYKNFARDLLDRMSSCNSSFLLGAITSLFFVSVTIGLSAMTFQDLANVNVLSLGAFLAYGTMTIIILRSTFLSIRDYYRLRDAFVKLSEEPSYDKCVEIDGNLEERGISI